MPYQELDLFHTVDRGIKNLAGPKVRFHWSYLHPRTRAFKAVDDSSRENIPADATDITYIPEGYVLYESSYGKRKLVHTHDIPFSTYSGGVPANWRDTGSNLNTSEVK